MAMAMAAAAAGTTAEINGRFQIKIQLVYCPLLMPVTLGHHPDQITWCSHCLLFRMKWQPHLESFVCESNTPSPSPFPLNLRSVFSPTFLDWSHHVQSTIWNVFLISIRLHSSVSNYTEFKFRFVWLWHIEVLHLHVNLLHSVTGKPMRK